jgi:serine/threonine protein kinase
MTDQLSNPDVTPPVAASDPLVFRPVPDQADPLIGRELGAYTILKRLGRGGGGSVYLADQPAMFRQVALKVISLAVPRDDPHYGALLARFQHEIQAISTVEHVHILPVYEWGEIDGYAYFSMRLAEKSLSDELKTRKLSFTETARLLDQLAAALDYAHQRGVIHRDLKPANILIDSQENFLLADFGIAHLLDNSAAITPEGSVMGTPLYMSPEQAAAGPVLPQSDIYSLAVIIFETVCGRVPFRGTVSEVLTMHINGTPPQPHELNLALPATASLVILKALSKSPKARYSTASAFAQAFRKAIVKTEHSHDPGASTTDLGTGPIAFTDQIAAKSDFLPVPIAAVRPIRRKLSRNQITGIVTVVGLLIAIITALILATTPRPNAVEYNQSGLQALQQLDYQTAISQFKIAIQADPNLASAYFNLGVSYEERADVAQNDSAAAISAYQAALSHDNTLLLARYRLAEVLLDQRQTDKAFIIVDLGVRLLTLESLKLDDQTRDTMSFLLYTTRGRAYWTRGDTTSLNLALNDIKTALSFVSNQPGSSTLYTAEAYYVEAQIYQAQGNTAEARQSWLNVLANSDPQSSRQRTWDDEARQALRSLN